MEASGRAATREKNALSSELLLALGLRPCRLTTPQRAGHIGVSGGGWRCVSRRRFARHRRFWSSVGGQAALGAQKKIMVRRSIVIP